MTDRQFSRFTLTPDCAARADEIARIVQPAFERQYGSGDGEVALIAALRASGEAVVELAALEGGKVVGHIMFSRLSVAPDTIQLVALAPLCAAIGHQKSGVGSFLIHEGLLRCSKLGFDAVAVLGDPAYYGRFGFARRTARNLQSEFSGLSYQAVELKTGVLTGGPWRVTYPRAFAKV